MLRAQGLRTSIILAQSFVSVTAPADATDDTLATISVPGNSLGLNGALRVTTQWSFTNSANNKTLRIKFGGTIFVARVQTTSTPAGIITWIGNVNATNSQKVNSFTDTSGHDTIITGAVDTTVTQPLLITGQKALNTETLTLESYTVELVR